MEETKEDVKKEEVRAGLAAARSKASAIRKKAMECVCEKKHRVAIAAIALLLAIGALAYIYVDRNKDRITPEEARDKAVAFVEKYMVQPGTEVEVMEISEERGLYKMTIDAQGQEGEIYVSRDGRMLFPGGIDMEEYEKKQEESNRSAEIPKSDRPTVDLYVMSFCPFGNKAEDTLKPAYDLLKDKADFNFRYIVSVSGDKIQSLHGQPETDQNMREACVMKDYGKDQWMNFATYVNTNCGSDGKCWEAGARSLKLDVAKINSCVKNEGLALMKEDAEASDEAGATGSPTMLINGVSTKSVYQYGNSESYKQAICEAFNEAPEECGKVLGSATATSAGGSCN